MLGLLKSLKDNLKLKVDSPSIDNWVFRLHYRATTTIFFVATILVTSREYIGEHIKCVSDSLTNKDFHRVIESFCFFSTTFSVVSHPEDANNIGFGYPPHPGVFPYGLFSKRPIRKHLYYQWVPFVLFAQGLMFYLTHMLWKCWENRRLQKFVSSLAYSGFAFGEKEVKVDGKLIPSRKSKEVIISYTRDYFYRSIKLNKDWAPLLTFCEVLNTINVFLQAFIINKFLGGYFYTLGIKVFTKGQIVLDEVFPKVTKCTFHKFGPSGTVQLHDALCVMALNIINEKIYVFLWIWFIFLLTMSSFNLLWRFLSFLLYSKITLFSKLSLGCITQKRITAWQIKAVTKHFGYSEWIFLKYLAKNLDSIVFKELFDQISENCDEATILLKKDESSGKNEQLVL